MRSCLIFLRATRPHNQHGHGRHTIRRRYHAHVHGVGPAQFPEFDFLYTDKSMSAKFVPWKFNIATIANQELKNEYWGSESLFKLAKPSLVGKNEKTVLDETVRKSSEITADQIQLGPAFNARVSSEIQQLAQTLGHPTKVIAKLHKLVIYKEGDFFDTHVDSPHDNTEPMIFTASVQLKGSYWSVGGDLIVGEEKVNLPPTDEIGIALFYHDTPHSVTKVERGMRVSLVFDVVDSGVPNPAFPVVDARAAFAKVLSMGFSNVAIQSSYSYFTSKQVTADQLKGSDKVFCEAALAAGARSIEICGVCVNKEGHIFRAEVLPLMKLEPTFRTFYRDNSQGQVEGDDKEAEEERKRANAPIRAKLQRPRLEYDDHSKFSPLHDDNSLVALKDEYRLGDTLFLAAAAPSRLAYIAVDDNFIGNEGYYGKIHSNLAIIAHF